MSFFRLMTSFGVVLLLASAAGAQTPSFHTVPIAPGCKGATLVRAADFNGDHFADLIFFCPDSTSVLLGNGDGSFQKAVVQSRDLSTVSNAVLLEPVIADFNRDGKADIAYFDNQEQLNILLSNGDGTFQSLTGKPLTQSTAEILAAGDLDLDGNPDLVISISGTGAFVMFGNGDGTFTAPSALAPAASLRLNYPAAAAIADFNGDGKPDLVLTGDGFDQNLKTVVYYAVYFGTGRGAFAAPTAVTNAANISYAPNVFATDVNGDGKPDLILAPDYLTPLPGPQRLYVLLNSGTGVFQTPVETDVATGPFAAGDLNVDGKTDLVQLPAVLPLIVNGVSEEPEQSAPAVLISKGDGTFAQSVAMTDMTLLATSSTIADVTGDGKPDIITTNAVTSDADVLVNTTAISSVSGALNAASFSTGEPLAPGSLVSIFGSGFASARQLASTIPLPITLGGVSVTVGGVPAPLEFVGPTQINLQIPWNVNSTAADIVVTVNGKALPASHATLGMFSPGIFTTQSGTGQAIAINSDGSLAAPNGSIPGLATRPAHVGDTIILLGTGLGPVTPAIASGAASTDTLRTASVTPSVLIGGVPALVSFAGLSPQFVGVDQINVVVPPVPAGVVPVQIQVGGITTSNQVTMAVGP